MAEADADTAIENNEENELNGNGEEPTGLEEIEPNVPAHARFLEYLSSPIVELTVGNGDDLTVLSAHRALLSRSKFLAELIEAAGVNEGERVRLDLPDSDVEAVASAVEWLYKGDYYPFLTSAQSLEVDASLPETDNEGVGLLRHARIYTLAQRLQMPELSALAHKKIHLTSSTAKGEIAYARFVYGNTEPSDTNIRRPVAAFWAQRSHILRHEAEVEFRTMVLEYPQFGYDVLSLVLDVQEKRSQRNDAQSTGGSAAGRKRPRVSQA